MIVAEINGATAMEEAAHPFIHHLESCFGRIAEGWHLLQRAVDGNVLKIDAVLCSGGLIPDVAVVSTVGLSHFQLRSAASNRSFRQELFLMASDGQINPKMPAILAQIVKERLDANKGILRGEVLSKPGALFDREDFVALYATVPAYLPMDRWTFHDENFGDIVLCSLLPITRQEHAFLNQKGRTEFERLLDNAPFDLFDLNRPTLA
jgi:hypothetical protein